MAGLLGDSWDDPRSMAVMNLAAGLMGGGNFGQALGRGLAGYSDAMSNAKRQALLNEQMQWKRDEINREKAERERKDAIESNIQKLIRESFLPTTGPQAIAADALGPTPQKAESIGQTRPINFQALAAQGVPFERLKQLAESQNLGRSEVARTVKGIGPDGKEYEYQVDKFGQNVVPGMAQFRAPIMQDLGGQVAALDPYNLNPIGQFKKSMTPDAQASNAVAWANNAVSRDRLNFDKAGGVDGVNGGKPPAGYRWKMDRSGLEAIPGGPADIKAGELGAKMEAKKQAGIASADSVMQTIAEARDLVGFNTAGLGSWASAVPATDARNLNAKLETIKANLGFDRLQQMRDQSPTGGALGSVAVQELTALQSTVSSLDQAQSPSQLKASLDKINRHYANWQATLRGENPYERKAPAAPGGLGSGSFKILSVE